MKKHIQLHAVESHSPEWYEFRKKGLGGSEISSVLNLNQYKPALLLYHEKIGVKDPNQEDSLKMFMGRFMEDHIADLWQYWDGSNEGLMNRYSRQDRYRTCRRVNGYLTNPKYPWLFASCDRIINKTSGVNLITGEPLNAEGVLETKNMGERASEIWDNGIPPSYLIQVQTYLLITELEYGEVCVLKGGNELVVYPFEANKAIQEGIIEQTHDFWHNRVVPAREAHIAYNSGDLPYYDYEAIVQQHEPEPDATEAYKQYMSERFQKDKEEVKGTMEDFENAFKYKLYHELAGLADEHKCTFGNTLANTLVASRSEYINLPNDGGRVRYFKKAGGKNYQLDVKVNDKSYQSQAKEIFKTLSL